MLIQNRLELGSVKKKNYFSCRNELFIRKDKKKDKQLIVFVLFKAQNSETYFISC